MDSSRRLSYIFRKHSFFRFLCAAAVIAAALVIIFFVGRSTKPAPEIYSIVPPVGSPGDVIVINGKNFGSSRDMGYVEISGSRLTASSYIQWQDDCIRLVLPASVRDGLVYVGTRDARSKPALFANEVDIPVPVPTVQHSFTPEIKSLSSDSLSIGELLTITGQNFGDSRNGSRVCFTIDYNSRIKKASYANRLILVENVISAEASDYISWSDSEIKLRVPDGAYSGVVFVDNGKEQSEPVSLKISSSAGEKFFGGKKIYLLQYSADVSDLEITESSTITLRCPLPVIVPQQPEFNVTEVVPSPFLENYQGCMIHQITRSRSSLSKSLCSQTLVLPVYEVRTEVNADKIGSYKSMNQSLLERLTSADDFVPSDDEALVALSKSVIGNEKNPYRKASLLYSYMIESFKLQSKLRQDTDSPLDLIRLEGTAGDAYDFAVVYTALLRAAEIPAQVDCGILIGQDLYAQCHWWTEFYIPSVGWIPVDTALGAGLDYKKWQDSAADSDYYFGNLDAHHVLFSRGWNVLKPFAQGNKIVQYTKSFALQTIWEEASGGVAKYSSYWSVPVVKGVY